jgi:hypothetical protein
VRGPASAILHVLASKPFIPMISYSSQCFVLCASKPPTLTSLCSTCMCPNDEQQISFKSSPVLRMTILGELK